MNEFVTTIFQAGYKDGAFDGRGAQFQRDFDVGYAEGFKNGFFLGKTKGLNRETTGNDLILSKTARGQCVVCVDQSLMEKPIDEIRETQEMHMNKIRETLSSRYSVDHRK